MELKSRIERAFGSEIKYSKDCKVLAEEINQYTSRKISTATLRRFFGLLKSESKISRYSLDTLQSYLEQKNAILDLENQPVQSLYNHDITEEVLTLVNVNQGLNQGLLDDLINSNFTPEKFFKYLQQCILLAIEEKCIDFFIDLYRQNNFILDNPKVFRFIGKHLKSHLAFCKILLPELAKEKKGRQYFFERFVDTGDFKTYKSWLEIYLKSEPDYLNKLWALSILILGELLSEGTSERWKTYLELRALTKDKLSDAHPYQKARIYGVGLKCPEHKGVNLEDIQKELIFDKENLLISPTTHPLFSSMVCQYLILFKAPSELIKIVLSNFREYDATKSWIQDQGVSFYIKICELHDDGGGLSFEELKEFNSGHTNEDIALKLYAYKFLNDQTLSASKYKKELLRRSGFHEILK